jgi:hypothetical protein
MAGVEPAPGDVPRPTLGLHRHNYVHAAHRADRPRILVIECGRQRGRYYLSPQLVLCRDSLYR